MSELTDKYRIVLFFEDHTLFRVSLARFLASVPSFEIAGEASTVNGALEILKGSAVDVVLIECDADLEGGRGFMAEARAAGYGGRYLIVAAAAGPKLIAEALRSGASGIFPESEDPDRLVQAIQHVAGGETWVDPTIIQKMAEQLIDRPAPRNQSLTADVLEAREQTVLAGVLDGLTNKKIGVRMGLSEASVKNIVQRLFGKAGVKSRSQLVRVALDRSWAGQVERTVGAG